MIQGLTEAENKLIMRIAETVIKIPDDDSSPYHDIFEQLTSKSICRGSFEFGVLAAVAYMITRWRKIAKQTFPEEDKQ